MRIVAIDPQGGAHDVPLERALRVRFDRWLSPASVLRQSVLVTPGLIDPDSGVPKAGTYFFEPRYDPYDRTVVFALQPGVRWVPGVLQAARVLAPKAPDDATGIRAWDGAPLDHDQTLEFTTAEQPSVSNRDDLWPQATYCDEVPGPPKLPSVRSVLQGCVSANCHGSPEPAMGLDLSSAASIRSSVLRVVAHQAQAMPSAGQVAERPTVMGDGMARIDPGNPGNSYLLYKLLINGANYPASGDADAADANWEGGLAPLQAPSNDEIERLRAAFVRMDPMPKGGHLQVNQMRSLVSWMAYGAATPDCQVR